MEQVVKAFQAAALAITSLWVVVAVMGCMVLLTACAAPVFRSPEGGPQVDPLAVAEHQCRVEACSGACPLIMNIPVRRAYVECMEARGFVRES